MLQSLTFRSKYIVGWAQGVKGKSVILQWTNSTRGLIKSDKVQVNLIKSDNILVNVKCVQYFGPLLPDYIG